jgi:succinate dehydrogenase / fumarate reductase iron-sulfur subunit
MRLKVYRFDKVQDKTRYDTFEIPTKPGLTVLNALFYIQDNFDDSLSFRYSCRGAVCGSCAMLINKVPRLACRTQLEKLFSGTEEIKLKPFLTDEITTSWNPNFEVLIEPLPSLPVIKDLVVDMEKFYKNYRNIQPWLKPQEETPKRERLMDPKAVTELENYTNCILCASCFGACPVNTKDNDYLGPAALAKLYRFYIDPREGLNDQRLELANMESGFLACEYHTNCKKVCPKDVPPNLAIGKARKVLTAKLKELENDD